MIVAAMRANCEKFGADLYQQHLIIADVANEAAINEIGKSDTLCQIGAGWCRLFVGHCGLSAVRQLRREIPGEAVGRRESSLTCG